MTDGRGEQSGRPGGRGGEPRGAGRDDAAVYEALVDDVLDATADVAVFVLDDEYRVAWSNEATERYFGIDRSAVVGADKRTVVDERIKHLMADPEGFAATVLETYRSDSTDEKFECHVLAGDGRDERYLEHRSKRLESGRFRGGRVELYYDVTDRMRSERRLRRHRDKVRTLHDAATDLGRCESVEAVCGTIVEAAEDVLSFDRCVLGLEEDGVLPAAAVSSVVSEEDVRPIPVEEGIAGLTYRTGESTVVDDIWERPEADAEGSYRSAVSVPVGDYGVFQAVAEPTGAFDDRDRELAELLVSHAAAALERIDRESRLREREAALRHERDLFDRLLESNPAGIAVLDTDGVVRRVNEQASEDTGIPRSELLGERILDVPLLDEDGVEVPPEDRPSRRVLDTGEPVFDVEYRLERPDGERIWVSVDAGPVYDDDGELARVIVTGEDITERKRREQEVRRQRDELATLNRINAVIRDVDSALVQASTRAEIEEAVCERLAAADAYRFAWIGDRIRGTDEVRPRAAAGAGDGYLDEVTIDVGDDPAGAEPAEAALVSGSLWVAQHVASCPSSEPWRESALAHGHQAVAGIPLSYGESGYGVLAVYADRRGAFDERERDVLEQLGETIGHAIAAVESRKLLNADRVVELEFRTTAADSFFLEASDRMDCGFDVHQIVPTSGDALLYYGSVTDAEPDAVRELAEGDPRIDGVREVGDAGDATTMEFAVRRSSPIVRMAGLGAQVREATVARGEGRIVAGVTPDTDVRRFVGSVREAFPDLEFVSRREVDSEAGAVPGLRRQQVDVDLTERQQVALEAAFYGGYFEWPRESTAEEVADVVGVSSPTLHYHLRRAQRTVLAALLGEEVRGPMSGG